MRRGIVLLREGEPPQVVQGDSLVHTIAGLSRDGQRLVQVCLRGAILSLVQRDRAEINERGD